MFGADSEKIYENVKTANNIATGFKEAWEIVHDSSLGKIAPKLAPALGLFGVGFGFLDKLTEISPDKIVDNFNPSCTGGGPLAPPLRFFDHCI